MDAGREALDVMEAIYTTCAQRRLKPDPVPEDIIWSTLDTAIRGPSSGNAQRWSWLVVTDEAVKRPIAELYLVAWNELHCGTRLRLRRVASRAIGAADPLEQRLVEAHVATRIIWPVNTSPPTSAPRPSGSSRWSTV